jgi:chloramphenicol-sensitive protein RarD
VLQYSPDQLRTGLTLAVVANIIWGVAALYWIETQPVAPVDVVAHRAVWSFPIALLMLLIVGRVRETLELFKSMATLAWSVLATLLLSLNWGVFVYAVTEGRAQRAAVAMAIAAVVLQLVAYGSLPWISLVVSSSFALYGAIRKNIRADTLQGLFLETLCMAPFAIVWLWLTNGAGMGAHGIKVDLFLMLAGVYTTAPLLTYVAASRLLPLNVVGLTSYLGPTMQLLVAQTVLGEAIDTVTLISFALVWAGVLLVSSQGIVRLWRRFRGLRR